MFQVEMMMGNGVVDSVVSVEHHSNSSNRTYLSYLSTYLFVYIVSNIHSFNKRKKETKR